MYTSRFPGLAALVFLIAATAAADAASPENVVRQFVAAFDRHDLPAMIALAHPDIEWLSVDGSKLSIEAEGAEDLEANMSSYFESCSTCRSTIELGSVNGPYVTAVETACWESSGETRCQASTSVYEIVSGQVRRVWYYPAVKVNSD